MKKAPWLNKKINLRDCRRIKTHARDMAINTVCQEACCPNISECFSRGIATFMILGNICTRNCAFCAVKHGKPLPPDYTEPGRVREVVQSLRLKHVVITSPTRDDLVDKGADLFYRTVLSLRSLAGVETIEVLIPDFSLDERAITMVLAAKPDVLAHNIETVAVLYQKIRPAAIYRRSLKVLQIVKEQDKMILTKSGIILGFGEKEEEVIELFHDLRSVQCDFLTLGQYLQPSLRHYPVKEYIPESVFAKLRNEALSLGFKAVMSAPYVRSSYRAGEYHIRNIARL
ncbi:MAG: lipoyl synthase [Candidatus Omnitrophota bacterium]